MDLGRYLASIQPDAALKLSRPADDLSELPARGEAAPKARLQSAQVQQARVAQPVTAPVCKLIHDLRVAPTGVGDADPETPASQPISGSPTPEDRLWPEVRVNSRSHPRTDVLRLCHPSRKQRIQVIGQRVCQPTGGPPESGAG